MTQTTGHTDDEPSRSDVLWDGFITGALGAVTVALWFLVLDIAAGQPLHTPTVLGEALLSGPEAALEVDHARQGTVIPYSALHLALFFALGTLVAWIAARHRARSWGLPLIVAVFALFEVGAYLVLLLTMPSVAEAVSAWRLLVGNLLAIVAMVGYLLLRFPDLTAGREL